MPPRAKSKKEPKFEEAMELLEDIVERLERGDVPLEESLEAFERGVGLVRLLHGRLDAVQTKIDELTQSDDGRVERRTVDAGDEED